MYIGSRNSVYAEQFPCICRLLLCYILLRKLRNNLSLYLKLKYIYANNSYSQSLREPLGGPEKLRVFKIGALLSLVDPIAVFIYHISNKMRTGVYFIRYTQTDPLKSEVAVAIISYRVFCYITFCRSH